MKAEVRAAAHSPMVEVVNNDVPTDPKKLKATQRAQADARIKAAKAKVAKLKQFVATAPKGHKETQRAHLKGAEQALAQAIAAKERIS